MLSVDLWDKGEVSVQPVGIAGQIAFLLNLVDFGIISGAAMSQPNSGDGRMFQICGACWAWPDAGDLSRLIFFALSNSCHTALESIRTDAEVIRGWAQTICDVLMDVPFLCDHLQLCLSDRSHGRGQDTDHGERRCVGIQHSALLFVIFGKLGLPSLEFQGAAVAAVIARAFAMLSR